MPGNTFPHIICLTMMLEIGKLAFAYDPAEDRLRLDVTGETGRCSLLLTRRLGIRWLKALTRWLEAGGEPPQILAAVHVRALSRLARGVSGAPRGAAANAEQEMEKPIRLSRIEFAERKQSIKVVLYTGRDLPVAAGTFGRPVVHGLVQRLVRKMEQAGWGDALPVPKWCRAGGEAEPPPRRKATLH